MMKLVLLLAAVTASHALAESVQLSWDANPASENVIGYRVYQSQAIDIPFLLVAETPAIEIQLDVIPGVWFWYVTAYNFWGETDRSNTANTPAVATQTGGLKICR